MLDESPLGHQPNLVGAVLAKVAELDRQTSVSILIVEQKVRQVLDICDRVYSLKFGKIAFSGGPEELEGGREKLRELFL